MNKHIKVSFLGDVAVDEGGPRREFLTLLMSDNMAGNNSLFLHQRLPRPNLVELNKRSFYEPLNMVDQTQHSLLHLLQGMASTLKSELEELLGI